MPAHFAGCLLGGAVGDALGATVEFHSLNVWEWCEGDLHNDYGGAPLSGTAWVDRPGRGSGRVFRGGGWYYLAVGCRSAYRDRDSPGNCPRVLGFRFLRIYH